MKAIIKIIFILFFCLTFMLIFSCSKYEVVSELKVNLYHLHNPKTKKAEIILTEQKLEIGQFYNIKRIKTIDIHE